jgi:phosphatidylserine/phosphatidylglycerophosphate/cardiolipin synthase-like enzyme
MRAIRLALALIVIATSVIVAGISVDRLIDEHDQSTPAPTAISAAGVRGLFVEPDDGREPVVAELNAAMSAIDVHIYLLTDDDIIDALVGAEARGVSVRVILEQYPFGGAGNPEEVADQLRHSGAEVRWASHEFSFSHLKTIVVDKSSAIVMNLNLSRSSFEDNREFGLVTTVQTDVESVQAVFDVDWNRTKLADPGSLVVSPLNSRAVLTELIDSAEKSVDIFAEVIRDGEIVDRLSKSSGHGVSVRIILSPDDDPVNLNVLKTLRDAGVEIRLMAEPYVHAKAIIVDGRTAFVGSQNLTETSLDENREVGIVVDEPEILQRLAAVFESDYARSELLAVSVQSVWSVV